MTERLYYSDSYLKQFTGAVVGRIKTDDRISVVLDQTAFYPESGGQPCDTGYLGEARVLRVLEDESGGILHVLDRDVPDGPLCGLIDWERRFDHMQQHTGQHILSQAFLSVAQAATLSFRLGQEVSTIDLDLASPTPSQMLQAQTLASRICFENRPVRMLSTDRGSLDALGVRKSSDREGEIRVIEVEGFDRSPCGGTHVRSTGEIGLVAILDFERYKGSTRVEFVCGYRALNAFAADRTVLKRLGEIHSARPDKIPELAEKLLRERSDLVREKSRLEEQLLEAEAEALVRSAKKIGPAAIVRKTYSGRPLESIKVLARKIASHPGAVALLAVADAGQIVAARSADLSASCHEAVRRITAEFGGKGGGRPELAQAGGFSRESVESILEALEAYFSETVL